jgi:hypothetical protein
MQLRVATLLATAATSFGCAQAFGVDEYRVADPERGGAGESSLPLLPAQPDARFSECASCVATKCWDKRAACVKSKHCRDMLACQGKCSDPACIAVCTDTLPRSADFDDYFACAFNNSQGGPNPVASRCLAECGAGQNLDCAGAYGWTPGSEKAVVHMQLREVGAPATVKGPLVTLQGVDIAPCNDIAAPTGPLTGALGCDTGVPVDEYGAADVELTPSQIAVALLGGAGERQRVYLRPITQSIRAPSALDLWVFSSVSHANYLQYFLSSQADYDPTLGVVAVFSLDCIGSFPEAHVELSPASDASWFCPDGLDRTQKCDKGLNQVFYNVPPNTSVRVSSTVDASPINPVAVKNVLVAGGWLTTAYLYPQPLR